MGLIMKVLVTGANGFIGKVLCIKLVKHGYKPIAFIRHRQYEQYFIERGITCYCGSLLDQQDLIKALAHVEVVIHLAGGGKAHQPSSFYDNNVLPTQSLLKAIKQGHHQLKRFIFISSLAAAGPSKFKQPKTNESSLEPISPYGRSKALAEQFILEEAQHIHVTILRPPAIYGPGDWRLRPLFTSAQKGFLPILGGLPKYMSMIHVEDCAQAIICAIKAKLPSGKCLFIDDGQIHSIQDLAAALGSIYQHEVRLLPIPSSLLYICAYLNYYVLGKLGKEVLLTPHKAKELLCAYWTCDSQDSQRLLTWSPQKKWINGLMETAKWYQENP